MNQKLRCPALLALCFLGWGMVVAQSTENPNTGFPLLELVPDQVWSVQPDFQKGIADAVILEHRTKIDKNELHHYRLIRIFSRTGQEAAGMIRMPKFLTALKGRIVDRSGRETLFDKRDVLETLAYKNKEYEEKTRLVLPPGLTQDCLLEVSWSEKAESGLPADNYSKRYLVQEPFYCKTKEFFINEKLTSRMAGESFELFDLETRANWSKAPANMKFVQTMEDNYIKLTYSEIPPLPQFPFGDPMEDDGIAFLQTYGTYSYGKGVPKAFWNEFCANWIKIYYERPFTRSMAYQAWLKEIKANWPEPAGERLTYVHDAFKAKITHPDMLPDALRERYWLMKDEDLDLNTETLAQGFEQGFTSRSWLGILLQTVLRDLGIKTKLIFATPDRYSQLVPSEMNPFSLALFRPLIAFKDEELDNVWHLLAAGFPEYKSGFVPPWFLGQPVLLVDPDNQYVADFIVLPEQDWKRNKLRRQYKLSLAEDGKVSFVLKQSHLGVFNGSHRRAFFGYAGADRALALKDEWRDRLPEWQITSTHVEGVDDFTDSVALYVRGIRSLDTGGLDWIALDPFPGEGLILGIPDDWPDDRTQPISIPYNFTQQSESSVELPAGWVLKGASSWQKTNDVGSISVLIEPEEKGLKVTRRIILAQSKLPADKEAELKTFFAWMEMAFKQTLAIVPGGGR